jgi:hypothetical protein
VLPTAFADLTGISSGSDSVEQSSMASHSSSSSSNAEDLQQLLQGLDSESWQGLASQVLPDLYDAAWHSSMYTFMQDVWRAALQQVPGSTAAAAAAASGGSSSSSAAVCWCLMSLYCSRRYVWGSTLLALVDILAEDDVGLAAQAVQLLPDQLLEEVVLPVAELLDDEVHSALQQEMKRKRVRAGGSAAAAAAAALIGPAPWVIDVSAAAGDIQSSSTAAAAAAVDASTTAAGAAGRSAEQVALLLQELRSLQGLYPGVELPALAHVAQAHGLWRDEAS